MTLLLLAGGYTAFWFYVAGQLQSGLAPWAEARRAEGYTVEWRRIAVDGFPKAFRLHIDEVALAARQPADYAVAAPSVVLQALPWNLARWRLWAPDGAHVTLPGETAALDAGALDGVVRLGTAEGTVIDLTARQVAGRDEAQGLTIGGAQARLTLPQERAQGQGDCALRMALRVAQLTLPRAVPPFGGTVEAFSLAATLKGPMPQGPLYQSLAAWRDDGGTVEVEDGRIRWGALVMDAGGTLKLDRQLQPTGALTAHFKNQNAVVDAAVAAGGLHPDDAGLAKAFLGLMAKPGPDGEKQITVPVHVQNERIFLGPAQVAQFPKIAWR